MDHLDFDFLGERVPGPDSRRLPTCCKFIALMMARRTIFNRRYKDHMWLDDKSPYVSGKGDPKKDSAQWVIEGLPDRW